MTMFMLAVAAVLGIVLGCANVELIPSIIILATFLLYATAHRVAYNLNAKTEADINVTEESQNRYFPLTIFRVNAHLYCATFPDFPTLTFEAKDIESLLSQAKESLRTVKEELGKQNTPMPIASTTREAGEDYIALTVMIDSGKEEK